MMISYHCIFLNGKSRNRQGFSLIEIAIVIVIIGLIVGGVLAGQSLVRQSQINSAMTDAQQYISAAQSFQQKYGALPGDFMQATNFWTAASTCPPTNAAKLTGVLTCNGDGDGQIETATNEESLLFWNHLMLAQMIGGKYNGSPTATGTQDHVMGINAPASRVDGAGFGVNFAGGISGGGDTNYFDNLYGNALYFGAYQSNFLPAGKALTTAEAYGFDTKYDDGSPATGNIVTWKTSATSSAATSCATSSATTATYRLTLSGLQCALLIITGF